MRCVGIIDRMTPRAQSERVKALAAAAGFNRVGITRPAPAARAAYYRDWLAGGQMGTMGSLARNRQIRENSQNLLPGARSIICVALNYGRGEPLSAAPDEPHGRVAQYARGEDYHRVMYEMLRALVSQLRSELGDFDARICVDSAPVLERELAAAAGLGWIGKNTLVLHERQGSYAFLGEVFTTLELEPDGPVTDHCGTCTRCLDACPTGALRAPYQMDARRCISYLTIEYRGPIPDDLKPQVGDWLFGCDICQEVCPFNSRAPQGSQPAIMADRTPARLPLVPLIELRSGGLRRLTRKSALRRASLRMWRRNARLALENLRRGAPR
jgi:epoxyqueuosine reductase